MKICHFSSVHDRYDPRVFQKECSSLAKAGYQVTYLVNDGLPDEVKNGVTIKSTGLGKMNHLSRIKKATRRIKEMALAEKADVYQFHDPELIPVGKYLKKRGYVVIDDVHEDVPRDILSKTWIPKLLRNMLSCIVEKYEEHNLGIFDCLITVSPFLVERLEKINPRVVQVTNYPIISSVPSIDKEDYFNRSNTICFTGAISSAWQHGYILDALKDIQCRYLMAGKTEPGYLESLEKHHEYKKVEYRGVVPSSDVLKIFEESKIGMAVADYRPGAGYKKGTLGNTKIYEYMRAGLPIVCTDFDAWIEQVGKYDCGICVNPSDSAAIGNAIKTLLDNPEKAYQMGQNGQRAVLSEYNWESQFQYLLDVYKKFEVK